MFLGIQEWSKILPCYGKNRIDYVCVLKHNAKSTVCDAESGIKEKNDYNCLKSRLKLVVGSAIIWIDKCYTSTINKDWRFEARSLECVPLLFSSIVPSFSLAVKYFTTTTYTTAASTQKVDLLHSIVGTRDSLRSFFMVARYICVHRRISDIFSQIYSCNARCRNGYTIRKITRTETFFWALHKM